MTHKQTIGPLRIFIVCSLMLACVVFIFGNSMQTAAESSLRSEQISMLLQRVFAKLFGIHSHIVFLVRVYMRKIAHMLEFAMLGATCILAAFILGRINVHTALHSAFFILLVAVADETIQLFYDGRGSSVLDVVIDFAGGVGGIVVSLVVFGAIRALFRSLRGEGAMR